MNLTNILPQTIISHQDKKAIVCEGKEFNYKQFACRVHKLANSLINLGVTKGSKVAILDKNCHYFLEGYFGVMHSGAALVPLNHYLSSSELAFIINNSETGLLIANKFFSKKVEDARNEIKNDLKIIWTGKDYEGLIASADSAIPITEVNEQDIAQIYYTSGTTGMPKGVILSHKNVYYHALCSIDELAINKSDVWLHAAPLFHLADAWATWAITIAGGTHILVGDFKPDNVCSCIEKNRVTLTNLVPTMYYRLVNYPLVKKYNFSSLRLLMSGGAPISPSLVEKIIDTFKCDYIQTYGMTETSPFLTMSILKDHLQTLPYKEQLKYKSTTGRKFKGVELRIINGNNEDVKNNNKEVGEIIVKGDSITKGYWKLPKETEKVFKNGWLYTGDMAVINKDGYINIVDRKDDMIITGGENVYSIEVENVLYTHPAVLECVVIGVQDEEWGEIVKAIVVLKDGKKTTERDIIEFCKQRISAYKVPKFVEFRECLPKLGSGKICKKSLREK